MSLTQISILKVKLYIFNMNNQILKYISLQVNRKKIMFNIIKCEEFYITLHRKEFI